MFIIDEFLSFHVILIFHIINYQNINLFFYLKFHRQ